MESNSSKFSFSKKFLSGEAHYGFWDSVAEVLGFVNTFFIITALSLTEYGVFQLLLSLYAIFSNFLSLGGGVVGNDMLRFVGEGKEPEAKRLFAEYHGTRLILAVFVAIFMVYGSTVLTHWYSPAVVSLLQPMAILLILEVLFSVGKSLLGIRLHFGLIASRSSMYKIAQIAVLAFYFMQNSLGIREVIFSMIAGSLLSSVLLIRPTLRAWGIWQSIKISSHPIIFWVFAHHGKWDILQQFTSKLTAPLLLWIIKVFINTEAVAIYSVAQTMVSTVVGFLPTKTLNTLVPLRAKDPLQLQKIYSYAMKYIFIVALVFVMIAAVLGPLAIYIVFPKYASSLPYFFGLLLYLPITALSSVTSTFLVVVRKQEYLFYQKIFKGITALPMILLVMFLGLWGVVAYQVTFSLLLFYTVYLFLRSVPPGFRIDWKNFFKFGTADKEFVKDLRSMIFAFFRKKIPFLSM